MADTNDKKLCCGDCKHHMIDELSNLIGYESEYSYELYCFCALADPALPTRYREDVDDWHSDHPHNVWGEEFIGEAVGSDARDCPGFELAGPGDIPTRRH